MQDIGHSSLLKFLVKNTMSEKNIESKVPGEHNMREVIDGVYKEKETLFTDDKAQSSTSHSVKQNAGLSEGNTSEIATADDFTLSPVITVTKEEATFTKGEMKLQKVTVTEDISHISSRNDGEEKFNRRLTYEIQTAVTKPKDGQNDHKNDEITDSKRLKTKIPMSRLRQAVNRVKNDLKEKKRLEKEREMRTSSRKSSIPRLKDSKIPPKDTQLNNEENLSSKADEEFDKIFQDLSPSEDASLEFINTDIGNINQLENSFEEIIHAYEDNTITMSTDKIKQSRIPLLKRKSEHEIYIPKPKEKQALKKSNSVDTKVQTTFSQDIKEKIVSEQTKIYTQSNIRTQIYTVQKDHETNNTVIEKQSSFKNETLNQELNKSETKEKVKVAFPIFDIQTTEDKLELNETIDKSSIGNEEDLSQDITITKNLNFDKETVSKIYKIDFTENNFDSLDMTLINESIKQDQNVKNIESNDMNITKEVTRSNEFKSNTKHYGTSSKTTKVFETTNYNENIKVDDSEVKGNQTTEIKKETFAQTVKSNENIDTSKTKDTKANISTDISIVTGNEILRERNVNESNTKNEKVEITIDSVKEFYSGPDQGIIKEVLHEANIIEAKASGTDTEIQSMKPERSLNIASNDIQTVRHISQEGNSTAINTNNENLVIPTVNSVNEHNLFDNAKNIELILHRDALETRTSAVFTKQTVKTSENNKNIAFDIDIIRKNSLEGNKTTEIETNQITAKTLKQSVETNESSNVLKKELQDNKTIEYGFDESFIRDVTLKGYKTMGSESSILIKTSEGNKATKGLLDEGKSIVTSVSKTDNLSSEISTQETTGRNEKEKLDQLEITDKYKLETSSHKKDLSKITLDTESKRLSIESSIKLLKTSGLTNEKQNRTSLEGYSPNNLETEDAEENLSDFLKNKRNKSTKLEELSRRYENIDYDSKKISLETNKSVENKTTTNTSNEKPIIFTDTSENIRTLEELNNTKDQLIDQKSNNEFTQSISTSVNEDKVKETFTINKSKSEINKQIITSNKITTSNTFNKLDTTKSLLNINTQNTEEINKIYSEVFTKINAQNKESIKTTKIKEVKEISEFNKSENIPNKDAMEEDIPILRGKVNRVIQRISSIDNTKSVEKNSKDLPKKISILSKIQMFERGKSDEVYQRTRIPKLDSKTSRIPNPLRQTSTELRRPKIVEEILKVTNDSKEMTETAKVIEDNQDKVYTKTVTTEIVEGAVLSDKNLKADKSLNYSQTDTRLLITDYKQVKDIVKEINKTAEVPSNKNESNLIEKTNLSQSSFDNTNTEGDVYNKHYGNQKLNTEIINKVESTKYTKIYANSDQSLSSIKYESVQNQTIDNSNEINEELFNFTPKDNSDNKSMINKDITNKYINNEYNLDNKAKSLEYIRQSTRKSYDRLESDYKERREFDMKRTNSVAELEIGGVVKGRVFDMIMRINSMEILSQVKREIHREQTRKSSVSEMIALFEGRLPPIKTEKKKEVYRMKNETEVSVENTEEYYSKKIKDLRNVKNIYESLTPEFLELRDTSEMPVVALGTALLDKRLIKDVVEAAIDMGYRAIDTAYIYGNEKEIGEAINNKINDGTVKREDLYVISKLWSTYHRKDLVETACRQSLDIMGLTYFDLYLIHNPMSLLEGSDALPKIANVLQYSEHDYMDAWRGIEDLIIKGLVRRGGVSNFNSEQIHRVMEKGRIKPVANQVECHPYLSQERLGGFCDAYGMRLSCYGVLGSKGTPAEHKSDLPPVIDDPLVLVMAAGLGVTPAQMLVAYQLHNSRSVVIKATSAAHLYENLEAQFISLEPSHLTALKSLNKNKRTYYLKGLGETHKNYPFNIAF